VVIISGRKPEFAVFYSVAEPGFRAAGAALVEVPFLGYARGSTAEAFLKPLLVTEVQGLVRECVAEWANGAWAGSSRTAEALFRRRSRLTASQPCLYTHYE